MTIELVGIEIGDGGGGLLRERQRSDGGVTTRIGNGALAQVGGAALGHAGLGGVAHRTTAPGGGAWERQGGGARLCCRAMGKVEQRTQGHERSPL